MSTIDDRRFDVRLIEARIRRGAVKADEYAKYLDSLPDEADQAEESKVAFIPTYASRLR